jgi:hypothetical protein
MAIRPRELEIFYAFTERALELVKAEDKDEIANACRLAETGFKAVRGDGAVPPAANDDGIQRWLEEIDKGYERLRAAKAAAGEARV